MNDEKQSPWAPACEVEKKQEDSPLTGGGRLGPTGSFYLYLWLWSWDLDLLGPSLTELLKLPL